MRISIAAALLLTVASPALADPVSGFYAGVYGGVATHSNADYDLAINGAVLGDDIPGLEDLPDNVSVPVDPDFLDFLAELTDGADASLDEGVGITLNAGGVFELLSAPRVGAIFGYGFGNGLRVEADLSTGTNAVGGFTIDNAGFQVVVGELVSPNVWNWDVYQAGDTAGEILPLTDLADFSLGYTSSVQYALVNAYYDFDVGQSFTPYVGGGVGFAHVTGTLTGGSDANWTGSAIVPAAQLGTGLRMALSGALSLDLGYRFRFAADPDLTVSTDAFVGPLPLSIKQSGPIMSHAVQAGLTYAFE